MMYTEQNHDQCYVGKMFKFERINHLDTDRQNASHSTARVTYVMVV